MTALSQQMQGKMTLVLNDLRHKTLARMTERGERIKNRPAVDDSFKQIQSHQVMQKNDDGATILGAAIGIPGLEGVAESVADVAIELYGDRKATFARPQDDEELSPKQKLKIREENRMDLEVFQNLDDKLNTLNTYIAQGYKLGLDWNGELIPWEEIDTPKQTMKITPEEELGLRADNLNHAPAMNLNRAPTSMSMRA